MGQEKNTGEIYRRKDSYLKWCGIQVDNNTQIKCRDILVFVNQENDVHMTILGLEFISKMIVV